MPFRFRFDALLKQRRYLFERAQLALAKARHAYEQVASERARNLEMIGDQHRTIEEEGKMGMPALRYLTLTEYLDFLEQQLQGIEGRLQQAAQKVEEKKKVLIERERGVKMLETLEENDKRRYRYEKLQIEQKLVDEVAVFQNLAKTRESGDN